MRNIRIADPKERIVPFHRQPTRTRSRLVDWLATVPIILLIPALLLSALPLVAGLWPQLALTPSTASPGAKVVVNGTGFEAGANGWLRWDRSTSAMPKFVVDEGGNFRTSFKVPAKATLGEHSVTAVIAVAAPSTSPQSDKRSKSAQGSTGSDVAVAVLVVTRRVTPTPEPTDAPTSPPESTPGPTQAPPAETATPAPVASPPQTPESTSAPTPAPATPEPTAATPEPAPECRSLQALVDSAPSGSVVAVPACIYRETVNVGKPLTLSAAAGAEIRGSDVWTGWSASGSNWLSAATVPGFSAHGACRSGTSRCLWPEQVFLDGTPLQQVSSATTPGSGQFAVNAARHVVLGDDPTARRVEVTVRTRWIVPTVDGVVIEGFRMRHAANDAQTGGITDGGRRLIVRDSVLSDAHGAVVSLRGSSQLIGNDIFRGGQLGVHHGGAVVRGNRIHDNNTEDFEIGWEAGGLKSTSDDQLVENNEVYDNRGPGLWFDIGADRTNVLNNRVHDNDAPGIWYEISTGGRISGNAVWRNGRVWQSAWGWGAGILLSSSRQTEVSGNVVAWNADGISVVSQNRPDAPGPITGNYVHDNTVVHASLSGDGSDQILLGWLQDWAGVMYDAASDNRGANNRYWHSQPEPSWCRFAWSGCRNDLAAFNSTSGEEAARYLSPSERDSALAAAAIPLSAEGD